MSSFISDMVCNTIQLIILLFKCIKDTCVYNMSLININKILSCSISFIWQLLGKSNKRHVTFDAFLVVTKIGVTTVFAFGKGKHELSLAEGNGGWFRMSVKLARKGIVTNLKTPMNNKTRSIGKGLYRCHMTLMRNQIYCHLEKYWLVSFHSVIGIFPGTVLW